MTSVAFYDIKPYDLQFLEASLREAGIQPCYHEFRLSAETALTARGFPVVCVFVNDRLDRKCLEKLVEVGVRMIALRCAGFNNVDVQAAKSLGLLLVRVPAYSPHSVAEHAVGLLLALNRKIHKAYYRVRDHNFSLTGLVGFDLHRKVVGIVGTGRIGRIAAQIFTGFESKVLTYDPRPDPDWADRHHIEYVTFDRLLSESDIISLHIPLTPQTKHILNAESFGKMKPGAYLINTSRGKLVETRAMIQALKKGRLGGVCLDVYEEEEGVFFEDLSDKVLLDDDLSRLLSFPNVLITSHQAFLTEEALKEIARVTTENIQRFQSGKTFLNGTAL